MAYRFCPGLVGIHIVPQHFADTSYLRSTATQICSRFKCTDTGFCHKVIGINENTRIDTVGLTGRQLDIFIKILQHLCDHLTSGGCIRLHIGQYSIFNNIFALSMVVKNDNRLCLIQQLRALGVARSAGIHHNDCRMIIICFKRLLAADEQIIRIPFLRGKVFFYRTQGCRHFIQHDLHFFSKLTTGTVNADGRAKSIYVTDGMPHDKKFIPAHHDLSQSQCFYPCFYPCVLATLTAVTAEIKYIIPCLSYDLIAATTQSQVNGCTGILIILHIFFTSASDTNTQCDSDLVSRLDIFYIFQNAVFIVFQFFQIPLFEYDKIFVFLCLFDQRIHC